MATAVSQVDGNPQDGIIGSESGNLDGRTVYTREQIADLIEYCNEKKRNLGLILDVIDTIASVIFIALGPLLGGMFFGLPGLLIGLGVGVALSSLMKGILDSTIGSRINQYTSAGIFLQFDPAFIEFAQGKGDLNQNNLLSVYREYLRNN